MVMVTSVALIFIILAVLTFPPEWFRNVLFWIICAAIIVGIAVILGYIFPGWGTWASFAFTPFAMHWSSVLLRSVGLGIPFYNRIFRAKTQQKNTGTHASQGNRPHSGGGENYERGAHDYHQKPDEHESENATTNMSKNEAMAVLGLTERDLPLTEAAIQAAYRRLVVGVHPDQGGSTYLTTKVNQARNVLLRLCP